MKTFKQYIGLAAVVAALGMWCAPALASGGAKPAAHGEGHHQLGHAPAPPPPVNWFGSGMDQKGKNVYGEPYNPDKGDEKMSPAFIWMLMNFALMLLILGKFAVPAIRSYAGKRHDTIKSSLDEAQKLHAEAKAMLAEYGEKIKDVDKEVDELITGIRTDAETERKRIIADAEKYAAAMKKDAEDRIANEIQAARAALEREVIGIAIAAAEKIISDKATPMDHKALIDSFIGDVGTVGSGDSKELS